MNQFMTLIQTNIRARSRLIWVLLALIVLGLLGLCMRDRPTPHTVMYAESHWYGDRVRTKVVDLTPAQAAALWPIETTEEAVKRLK